MGQTVSSSQFFKPNKSRTSQKTKSEGEKEHRNQEKERKDVNSNDRLENVGFEHELEAKRKKIEAKLEEKNKEKQNILKELEEIDKSLSEATIKIKVLDNYEEYYDLNQRLRKSIEREVHDKKLKRLDSDKLLKMRQNFRVNENCKEGLLERNRRRE